MEERPPLIATYLSHRETIGRMLAARLGNSDEAQEVMQELYVRLSHVEPATDVANPVAYVFKAALNLARDRRRERGRSSARDAQWIDTRYQMVGSEPVADQPSAEAAFGAKQRMAAVERALEELSPQCRRVFQLHKFEGLSHQDVAKRSGITRSTVEKHMNTALKHLIRRLGRDEDATDEHSVIDRPCQHGGRWRLGASME